jgi:hypothetical protein
VLQHLRRRLALVGLARGLHRRGQRQRQVVAGHGVVGELGGPPAGGRRVGQQGGVGGVQPAALPGQQLLVDRLAQQLVPEDVGVAAGGGALLGDQDVVGGRVAQRLLQLVDVQPGHRGQLVVAHPATGHRGDPQHPLGGRRQSLHPGHQHLGQAVRHAVGGGRDQLLGEERVALAAPRRAADHRLGQRAGGQQPDQLDGLGRAERRHLDALHGGQPDQFGQHRAQRVAAVHVVGAVAGQHHQPLPGEPGEQEHQQVAAGPVGPVQVLHHDQGRRGRGQVRQRGEHRVEHLELAQGAVLARRGRWRPGVLAVAGQQVAQRDVRGDQFGTGGREGADDLGERQVGQRGVTGVQATPDQHGEPGRGGPFGGLGHQPGLAHAGLAGQQHPGRASGRGPVQRRGQPLHLGVPADQLDPDPQPRHVDHRDTHYRQSASTLPPPTPTATRAGPAGRGGAGARPRAGTVSASRGATRPAARRARRPARAVVARRCCSASASRARRWCSDSTDASARSMYMPTTVVLRPPSRHRTTTSAAGGERPVRPGG